MLSSTRMAVAGGLQGRVFYGWVMVAVAAMGMFASGPGQSHTFSVFNQLIAQDLGISLTEVSGAYGIGTVGAAFLLPLMGAQVDRLGPRLSLILIVGGLGAACLLFGAVANMLWLVVGFAALRFLGQGSMMLGSANLVAQWFTTKRGFAMSLIMLGFGASIAIHPKLGQYLIDAYGWRTAWVILGVMTWAMMLPLLLLIVFDRPKMLGLHPDGLPPVEQVDTPDVTGPDLSGAIRHSSFYILCAAFFAVSALQTALHYHQVNVMVAQGLDLGMATNGFIVTSVAMFCMMPLVGRACDRFRTRYVFAAAMVVQAAALVAITYVTSATTMVVYAIIFGLNNALTMTLYGYGWPRYFGRRHLGKIQGTGQMVAVIGASVGPIPIAWAYDTTGDATSMIWWLALYPAVVAVICIVALKTHPEVKGTEHLE
ncbi:MAG: MFS transporter [Pseudomonadota bacterium]